MVASSPNLGAQSHSSLVEIPDLSDEADIFKTVYQPGSSGLYEFTHMPFELSNVGANFCHPMEMCLCD